MISLSNSYNVSVFIRLTLNYSGYLQRYIMNEQRDGWVLLFSLPNDACDNYRRCGPNTVCSFFKSPLCQCLKGFSPKFPKDWSLSTWTGGCTRTLPVDCQKKDGFLKVERIKYPDSLSFRIDTSMTSRECHNECLKNCSCSAYAAPYLSNEKTGCMMWFGDLVDIAEFHGEVSTSPTIYVRVPISELGKEKGHAKSVYAAVAACLGILFVGLVFGCIILMKTREKRACKKKREDLELPLFGLATVAKATNNFSKECMIGEGGFGPVYKGDLPDGQVVAVKRMSRTSGQGPLEFKNEVVLIAKLQHRNLVKILGCCIEGEEMMLIYEYMQNASLDYFIFDENRNAELSWPKRFDIIMGITRGLLYLHHDSRLKVIHRDLKTSNILLDDNLNAKISDFGLARMFRGDQTTASTKRVVGTYGYMAPEYVFDGNFSIKSDVYSMGVVILEIVSGKKNRGFKHPSFCHNLLEQAWLLWMESRELELMDPCYHYSYVESQVKRCIQIGLLCVQNVADDRPEMQFVLLMLSSEDSVLPQPKKPGFFLHSGSSSSQSEESGGRITMSEVEGR
ncbi:hypothetical protein ACS0TY_017549 [Phlomoides rotata]